MYRGVLDDAPIRRFCDRRRIERALQISFVAGHDRLERRFDLPTQIGLDSDDRWRRAKSAKSAWRLIRWKICCAFRRNSARHGFDFDDDQRDGFDAFVFVSGGRAKKQNVSFDKVNGTIQNDILKEYIARGTYIYPPKPSLRLITDIFSLSARGSSELEHDFDFRLSHPRSRFDRRAGNRFYAGRRHRLC
jgi:methylmalonyl-CoA mutase N-terminal domain/subunit